MAQTLGSKQCTPRGHQNALSVTSTDDALRARHNRTRVRHAPLTPAAPSDASACAHGERAAWRMVRARATLWCTYTLLQLDSRTRFLTTCSSYLPGESVHTLDPVPRLRDRRAVPRGDHDPRKTRVLCSHHGHNSNGPTSNTPPWTLDGCAMTRCTHGGMEGEKRNGEHHLEWRAPRWVAAALEGAGQCRGPCGSPGFCLCCCFSSLSLRL